MGQAAERVCMRELELRSSMNLGSSMALIRRYVKVVGREVGWDGHLC